MRQFQTLRFTGPARRRHRATGRAVMATCALVVIGGACASIDNVRPTTGPAPVVARADAKDHPSYGASQAATSAVVARADAKDHPSYGASQAATSAVVARADAKDHPSYGASQAATSPNYRPTRDGPR